MIDTLFSLAEAHLFMQLVELQDKEPHLLPGGKTRPDLYRYANMRKEQKTRSDETRHGKTRQDNTVVYKVVNRCEVSSYYYTEYKDKKIIEKKGKV